METKGLGQKLKTLRGQRGMSQEYLAEESKVSLRTIQRIENNESTPTGETIKRIANALEVQLLELTGSDGISETHDLNGTLVYLKKQRAKTNEKSEIKTFEKFISLLQHLKEKDLSPDQMDRIETYLQYLELDKIPSFNNDLYKKKLAAFKKYLKTKLRFVPNHYYTTWTASFGLAFAAGFLVQKNIDPTLKLGVAALVLVGIGVGLLLDHRIKNQERTLRF